MSPLPIDAALPEVVARLRERRSLVLVAPPGAGKTTRVPPALLRAPGLLSPNHPNLLMLQPRRVAARASAERIADENHWQLGREVGYHVRFDRKLTEHTRLRVLTEGILTRQLLADPFLDGVGAVLLDEFHERSLHTDVTAALLREVQQTVRPDLILVVMSATLEAQTAAEYFGQCSVIHVHGRTFPVAVSHSAPAHGSSLPERAADAVIGVIESSMIARPGSVPASPAPRETASPPHPKSGTPSTPDAPRATGAPNPSPGDVLVFLPGAEEIRRTQRRLEPLAARHDLLLLPLHGSLPAEDQTRALRPARQRKIILATNIAETSLTIDGVTTVVDTGFARVAGYDPRRGLDRLELQRISKASATQRAGRAGRTAPGRCVRLWSEREHAALADFDLPEVMRVDLAGTVLALHAWGKPDPRAFGWYEPPPEASLAAAERLLVMLGALTSETNGQITPLGRRLLSLPVHPRLARLLVAAAEQGLLHDGATIAALLSEKDIARAPDPAGGPGGFESRQAKVQGDSDLTVRMQQLDDAARHRFAPHLRDTGIDPHAARQVARIRDELLRIGRRLTPDNRRPSSPSPGTPGEGRGEGLRSKAEGGRRKDELKTSGRASSSSFSLHPSSLLLKLPLLAYPDRVCRRRATDPKAAAMVGGGGVRLAPESCVWQSEFFVALDARHDERNPRAEALVRVASAIQVEWLEELFPQSIRRVQSATFDEARGKVVGLRQTFYLDLLLDETKDAAVDPEQAAAALAEALRPRARAFFASDEGAAGVLARVALLRAHMPEHPWPPFDDAELGQVLAEAAEGKRGLDDLRRSSLAPLLLARLPYPLDRLLEQHAPPALEVPTGNRIKLDYAAGPKPVLAVRLQELFGWTDTPKVAGGRVPVLLHLLAPNYRPVQITEDLRSFWSTTYFQVRKDLRVRYPKHSWPDDPLTAKPEAKGTRRR
jgi:ATP-dependent helicase HrpB